MSNQVPDGGNTDVIKQKPLGWLFANVRPARRWILLSVAAGFSGGLLLILQARLLSGIIQSAFIDDISRTLLTPEFFMIGAVVGVRAVLAWAREVWGFRAGAAVRREIRLALMTHIGELGPAHPHGLHSGALASTVVEQVDALQDFYAHYLPQLALAVSIPAAIMAFVFPISWAAGGLLLLTAPMIPIFMILVGMGAETISQRHFQALARMSAHFLDTLQGLTTLKVFNRSKSEEKNIGRVSGAYRRKTMKVLRVAFLSTAVLEFFSSLSIALVAVYLGTSYLGYANFGLYGEKLTLGHGLFILLLAPDFYLPLRELGTHYHARAEAMGAAEGIMSMMAERPMTAIYGKVDPGNMKSVGVECRQIRFSYDPGQGPILNGVNLRLAPGETMVLVGESGVGKTTLLHLLLGFIRPQGGEIRVNDMPLDDLAPGAWRRAIAWVGQNPVLFHDTIGANIAMGNPGASPAEIEQAARSARVLEFSGRLPRGLDTRVGEQGWGLSRGQAQRVALARAFLKNAPMVLLDEPAASLDMENERLVMQAIGTLSRDRTVLLLTHRLDHIQTADRIVVLDGGKFVEQGSFTELMDRSGYFRTIVETGPGGSIP